RAVITKSKLPERSLCAPERRATRARRARCAGRRRRDRAPRRGQGIRTLDGGNVSHVPPASARCPSSRRFGHRQRGAAPLRLEKTPRPETADEAWRTVAALSIGGLLVSLAKPSDGYLTVPGSWFFVLGSGSWFNSASLNLEPGTENCLLDREQ